MWLHSTDPLPTTTPHANWSGRLCRESVRARPLGSASLENRRCSGRRKLLPRRPRRARRSRLRRPRDGGLWASNRTRSRRGPWRRRVRDGRSARSVDSACGSVQCRNISASTAPRETRRSLRSREVVGRLCGRHPRSSPKPNLRHCQVPWNSWPSARCLRFTSGGPRVCPRPSVTPVRCPPARSRNHRRRCPSGLRRPRRHRPLKPAVSPHAAGAINVARAEDGCVTGDVSGAAGVELVGSGASGWPRTTRRQSQHRLRPRQCRRSPSEARPIRVTPQRRLPWPAGRRMLQREQRNAHTARNG